MNGKPATSLATLRELAGVQRSRGKQVATAAAAFADAHARLDPKQLSPEFLAAERRRLHEAATTSMAEHMREISRNLETALAARTQWQPAARRLSAGLGDPAASVALAQRLATVPVSQLPALAREAAAEGNWLLADAIVQRADASRATGAPLDPAVTEVHDILDQMDAEDAGEACALVERIGAGSARARMTAAEASGRPLLPAERLTLSRQFPSLNEVAA